MRSRVLVAALPAVVALAAAGCTSGGDAGAPTGPHQTSHVRADGGDSGPSDAPTPARRPLTPRPVDDVISRFDTVLQDRAGRFLVVREPSWPRERTQFRVYGPDWKPRTPLLQVEASLEMLEVVADRFVGRATKSARDGTSKLDSWVTIDSRGRLDRLDDHRSRRPGPLERGDALLGSFYPGLAYREASGSIVRWRFPWPTSAADDVQGDRVCVVIRHRRDSAAVLASSDGGRSFDSVPLAALPVSAGPRVQWCSAARGAVVVQTGDSEYPRWLHTLETRSGALVSTQRLGDRLDPYSWALLPDGRLVTGTDRRGLMVATDPTNRTMAFRAGPVTEMSFFQVVGGQIIVSTSAGRRFSVSEDGGRTWSGVDLRLPPG